VHALSLEQLGREAWTSRWQETCGEMAPTIAGLIEQVANAVTSQGKGADERTKLRLALTVGWTAASGVPS